MTEGTGTRAPGSSDSGPGGDAPAPSQLSSSPGQPRVAAPPGEVHVALPPKQIGEFEIVRRLGIGGMAEVFLAKKRGAEGTFKQLVLKRILPEYVSNRRFRVMFADEAQLATRLNHPNIVQVYDFQDYGEDGQLLSMEYVDGPDLRGLRRAAQEKGARIPAPVAAYVVAEAAKGLHYAHERRDERGAPLEIVHRDVSPQNLLLSRDGAVKIADFGIASANLFREEEGVLKGKTAYMSPEQALGKKLDRRTDIYSLGVVLHELLTGRPLHGGLEGDVLLDAVRAGRVEPPSSFALGVPAALDEITLKALAVSPDERYQTARDLSVALSRALFELGELADAHLLETTIRELVGERELLPEGSEESNARGRSDAQSDYDAHPPQADATPVEPLLAQREAGREVRHVAVVSVGLSGHEALVERMGVDGARAALDRLAVTLGDIAFKRSMRLDWHRGKHDLPSTASAVAGLLQNPAGAAADAARFAVDVHEVVGAAREDLDVPIEVRIGIVRSTATGRRDPNGHLIEHELAGSALKLSEVLRDKSSGASLVAGGLYRLVRRDFLWGDAPSVEIDQDDNPELPPRIRVYRLIRSLTREEKLQEVALAPNELIGRDAEMADLHAAYYGAVGQVRGEARATARLVSGELGIGKTALVNAFLEEIPPDARVLRTDCVQARQDVPFSVIADWLRELTGTYVDQPLEEAERLVAESLAWTGPGDGHEIVTRLTELCTGRLGQAFDEGEVAHRRHSILSGVRHFLLRAAEEVPLVVVVDSLQWCDQASLELLPRLLHPDERIPVLLLLITRPDQRIAPYLEGVFRLDLGGLSVESQARLLQVRLGVGPGVERVCSDVFPRAAGNPFFLLEMVDALLERGVLEIREHNDGTQSLDRIDLAGSVVSLPTTLEQLIADRLTEISGEEQALLDWIAVAGGPIKVTDLVLLAGDSAEGALARLGERGLVEVSGGIADAKHPLTRDIAYRSMDGEVRRRLHRSIGELLAASGQSRGIQAAVVARHLSRGGNNEQGAELYLEAAHTARNSYQMDLATRSFRKAVALLPADDARLLDAHEALEAIMRNDGNWKERKVHLEMLRDLSARSQSGFWVATALLRSARYELDGGHLARAAELGRVAERAALEARAEGIAVQARGLLAEILRDLGDMQGALSAVDRALGSGDHPDVTPRLRAEILRARGTLLRLVGRAHEALDAYAESIAVFQQVGARRMEARTKSSMAFSLYVLGRYEDGISLGLDAMQIDDSIGGRFQTAKTLANVGLCYAGAGNLETAVEYLREARHAHERYGERDSRADTLLASAEVLLEKGNVDDAEALVGDAGALIQVTESRYDAIHERLLRAQLARVHGNYKEAVGRAFEARQAAEAQAYAAYHFYAMSIEAIARVEAREHHTGILLATTALGAIEAIQGSEYALQTRALAVQALERAGSPQAVTMRRRSAKYAQDCADRIRDPSLWRAFLDRPPVVSLLGARGEPPDLDQRSVTPRGSVLGRPPARSGGAPPAGQAGASSSGRGSSGKGAPS